MSFGVHMKEILLRWQRAVSAEIRQRDRIHEVWDIGWPGLFALARRQRCEAVVMCRRELMATVLESDGPNFLRHQESPQEYSVPGDWQPAGEATWLVPSDFNIDDPAVKHWLSLGDWTLYKALRPAEQTWPDVFRSRAGDVVSWMSADSLWALIESFHDDAEWVVALNTAWHWKPHYEVLHRPMKFYELIDTFWARQELLIEVFQEEPWRQKYLQIFLDLRDQGKRPSREVYQADAPLLLTREVAARYDVTFDLHVAPDKPDVYLLKEHEPDPSRFRSLPKERQQLTAVEVHDRFGGAVIWEAYDKGGCYVCDKPGWADRFSLTSGS